MSVCVGFSSFVRASAAPAAFVRRPGGWMSVAPAAGRSSLRRLDVRGSGGWTSAAPEAGRPPPRRLDVRRPGGWRYAAPAPTILKSFPANLQALVMTAKHLRRHPPRRPTPGDHETIARSQLDFNCLDTVNSCTYGEFNLLLAEVQLTKLRNLRNMMLF